MDEKTGFGQAFQASCSQALISLRRKGLNGNSNQATYGGEEDLEYSTNLSHGKGVGSLNQVALGSNFL
jgi:hypothetical protein